MMSIDNEDVVRRQAVMDEINEWIKSGEYGYTNATYYLRKRIDNLKSVNLQEPKTGHWVRWCEQKEAKRYTEYIPHCKCSECGKEYDPRSSQFIKYCNECGAKMVESEE